MKTNTKKENYRKTPTKSEDVKSGRTGYRGTDADSKFDIKKRGLKESVGYPLTGSSGVSFNYGRFITNELTTYTTGVSLTEYDFYESNPILVENRISTNFPSKYKLSKVFGGIDAWDVAANKLYALMRETSRSNVLYTPSDIIDYLFSVCGLASMYYCLYARMRAVLNSDPKFPKFQEYMAASVMLTSEGQAGAVNMTTCPTTRGIPDMVNNPHRSNGAILTTGCNKPIGTMASYASKYLTTDWSQSAADLVKASALLENLPIPPKLAVVLEKIFGTIYADETRPGAQYYVNVLRMAAYKPVKDDSGNYTFSYYTNPVGMLNDTYTEFSTYVADFSAWIAGSSHMAQLVADLSKLESMGRVSRRISWTDISTPMDPVYDELYFEALENAFAFNPVNVSIDDASDLQWFTNWRFDQMSNHKLNDPAELAWMTMFANQAYSTDAVPANLNGLFAGVVQMAYLPSIDSANADYMVPVLITPVVEDGFGNIGAAHSNVGGITTMRLAKALGQLYSFWLELIEHHIPVAMAQNLSAYHQTDSVPTGYYSMFKKELRISTSTTSENVDTIKYYVLLDLFGFF